MYTSYLGIGSNIANAESMIEQACKALAEKGCDIKATSDIYEVSAPYSNLVAIIDSELTYDQLNALTKDIETDMGRNPGMKSLGIVPIDIDVVIHDNTVKRERDYNAEYFAKGYRQLCKLTNT